MRESAPHAESPPALNLEECREKVVDCARYVKRQWRSSLSEHELASAGFQALYECTERYDPSKGDLWAFARKGVLGAMVCEHRRILATRREYEAMRANREALGSQEADENALSARERFHERVRCYVETTLDCTYEEYLAEKQRTARFDDDSNDGPFAVRGTTPEHVVLERERHARLETALEVLPERWRKILLRRFEGYSLAEIAAEFEIDQSRVSHIARDSLARLRDELDDGS